MNYLYYCEPTKDFRTYFITVAFEIASGKKKLSIQYIVHGDLLESIAQQYSLR